MEKALKKRIKKVWMLLCLSSTILADTSNLSFDSLFPVTWYQKALTFSLLIWQQLADLMADNNSAAQIPFDEIAGRLACAQFCLNRMTQNAVVVLDEDRSYMQMVLRKVKELVDIIVVTKKNEDFIECIQEMVAVTQGLIAQIE